jgi:hypothetical protein
VGKRIERPSGESGPQPQQGFTLLEVLVAASLSIVIGLGLATMMVNSTNGAKSAQMDADFANLTGEILAILSKPTQCPGAFVTSGGAALAISASSTTGVGGGGCPAGVANCVSVDAFATTGANLATQHLPVTGNTITMELDNPVNISGTTYAWTFKVTGTKTCASGTMTVSSATRSRPADST